MKKSFDGTRRALLRRGILGFGFSAFALGLPVPALAGWTKPKHSAVAARAIAFHNLHTDEKLSVTYWKDGAYDRAAWGKINHILRDHYSGDAHVMDLRLMDLLHDVRNHLGNDRPVEIISGYRSPATNLRLREASGGVAKNSYHMRGMAADVRFDGTPLSHLHDVALNLQRGGVGYYPTSDFVHIDVGPVRRWG
jgi:uncharacterized protein YcbK (DUF882 family)